MHAAGVRVLDTAVGDRYVLEALAEHGLNLGGEQSGHVIFRDRATTGDGLLTGISVLDVIARTGRPLAALAGVMTRLPQVLLNVRVAERHPEVATELAAEIRAVEAELGGAGRVLVRASGTEPLVRVMVEADAESVARSAAERLVEAAGRRFGVAR
jgi:phosphoglucosamine mutase